MLGSTELARELARIFHEQRPTDKETWERKQWVSDAVGVAMVLAKTVPRFSWNKWSREAGIQNGIITNAKGATVENQVFASSLSQAIRENASTGQIGALESIPPKALEIKRGPGRPKGSSNRVK